MFAKNHKFWPTQNKLKTHTYDQNNVVITLLVIFNGLQQTFLYVSRARIDISSFLSDSFCPRMRDITEVVQSTRFTNLKMNKQRIMPC